jgi:hypothetical protein
MPRPDERRRPRDLRVEPGRRAQLEAGAFDAAWAYGRSLTIDQAITTTLGEPV